MTPSGAHHGTSGKAGDRGGGGGHDPGPLPRIPARPADGHKGTFGTVCVVGGCAAGGSRMVGAPAISALAALRTGCGLAKIAAPEPVLDAVLTIAPVATGRPMPVGPDGLIIAHEAAAVIDELSANCRCLAIGPGLGRGEGARAAALRAVQQDSTPVVVDADAINELAEVPQLTRDLRGAVVMTPHPGEFRRMTRGLGMKDDLGLDRSRERAAEQLAQRLGCIIVLKGAGTVVTDGARTWVSPSANPCLSTAGSGDVLTGVIASLAAQFIAPTTHIGSRVPIPRPPERPLDLFDAARLGVHIHALAAGQWSTAHNATGGMLATDLLDGLPGAVESLRNSAGGARR